MLIKPNYKGNYVITCYNVHEKTSQKVKKGEIFESVRALFVICTRVTTLDPRYNFALVFHENALVFRQSESRNFFMYIIDNVIHL